MLEPFTAIGLAGNVAQFIEFSFKLFTETKQIYKSASGLQIEGETLHALATDLHELCAKLKAPEDPTPLAETRQPVLDEDIKAFLKRHEEHQALIALARDCEIAANELLAVLSKLSVSGKASTWSCFRAALKSEWKRSKVDDMNKRLDSFRMQLLLRLQHLESKKSIVAISFEELKQKNEEMKTELVIHIKSIEKELVATVKDMTTEIKACSHVSTMGSKQTYGDSRQKIRIDSTEGQMSFIADCDSKIGELSNRTKLITRVMDVQRSLYFSGMEYRHETISEAHHETCRWAYESKFFEWIISDDSLFWVSGRPGSGKSTLMKHVLHSLQTDHLLTLWSPKSRSIAQDNENQHEASCRIFTAGYFFWIGGSTIQRSRAGLIRSILFDLLNKFPEIVSMFPMPASNKSSPLERSHHPNWSFESALEVFKTVLKGLESSTKLCIFIDGLDEYEGEQKNLVELIQSFNTFPNLKLCIASRPWTVFEKAFGQHDTKKLYMQDLNAGDIQRFVESKLEASLEFQRLTTTSTEAAELVQEVVNKANGVFLWVSLIVTSLLEGLQNADRIIDLRRRLKALPKDLDGYFRSILNSLDPTYKEQVARGFQAALTARYALSAMQFWYLDQEEEEQDYAIKKDITFISPEDFTLQSLSKIAIMTTRISGRFKGLLEVSKGGEANRSEILARPSSSSSLAVTKPGTGSILAFNPKVDFLHRTVQDFLLTSDCRDILFTWTSDELKIDHSICQANLAVLKDVAGFNGRVPNSELICELVVDILERSKDYELKTGQVPTPIYQELRRTLEAQLAHENIMPLWVGRTMRPSAFFSLVEPYCDTCLEVAISYDAVEFIKAAWPSLDSDLNTSKKSSCLEVAIFYRAHGTVAYLTSIGPQVKFKPDSIRKLMTVKCKTLNTREFDDRELQSMVKTLSNSGLLKRAKNESGVRSWFRWR